MDHTLRSLCRYGGVLAAIALTLGLLAGCESLSTVAPAAPELQLVSADDLSLPRGCEPASGAVYRLSYVVERNGRIAAAVSESGSGCVQDALRRWGESFQYAPPPGPVPVAIDWMAVTAARGG